MGTTTAVPAAVTPITDALRAAWTAPDLCWPIDGVYAFALVPAHGGTEIARLSGFSFAVPAGKTITGLTVWCVGHDDAGSDHPRLYCRLVPDGKHEEGAVALAPCFSNTDAPMGAGGAASGWSTTLTPAVLNDTRFSIDCWINADAEGAGCTAWVDGFFVVATWE